MASEKDLQPDFNRIHELAIALADKAKAVSSSDPLASKGMYLQAASMEHAVLQCVVDYPTNAIVAISGACLYFNGEDYARAELLANTALSIIGDKTEANEYYFTEATSILHDAQENLQEK